MPYSKKDKKRYYTLQCRYYNGEACAPPSLTDMAKSFWYYESLWVEWNVNDSSMIQSLEEEIKDYGLKTESEDRTPLMLKALLCNRYLHGLTYQTIDNALAGFEKWYVANYLARKTNFERRYEARRKKLIQDCRYYHGEETNPWSECTGINMWRANFWNWEASWVHSLATSYTNAKGFMDCVKDLGLEKYFKDRKQSRSLINHILIRHIDNMVNFCQTGIGTEDAVYFYENMYLAFTPLGKGSLMYLGFLVPDRVKNPMLAKFYSKYDKFLSLEEMYFDKCHFKDFEKTWIDDAENKLNMWKKEGFPAFLEHYNDIPVGQLAIALYVDAMTGKWCPYEDLDEVDKKYIKGIEDFPLTVEKLKKKIEEDSPKNEKKQKNPMLEDVERNIAENDAAQECVNLHIESKPDVHLFGTWKDYSVWRPELCLIEEEKFKYPVVILIDKDLKAEFLCSEKSKEIYNSVREYRISCEMKRLFFYKGEKECPYTYGTTEYEMWDYERYWLNDVMDCYIRENNYIIEYMMDIGSDMDFDPRPMSFKAMLYNVYGHWGVTKESFIKSMKQLCDEYSHKQ